MERLSLHPLVAIGATPKALLEIAARLTCPTVSLFVTNSEKSRAPYVETIAQAADLRRQAQALDVGIYGLEVFSIDAQGVTDSLRRGLEIGAELGAKRLTTCIYDPDLKRAADNFEIFHDMADKSGLAVHIEFHAFGTLNTLSATRDFLSGVSAQASICADVLHLYRNEGGLESLSSPHPIAIGHAQICDGPLERPRQSWLHEAVADRLRPGEGAFDLAGFVNALPESVRIDVEAPVSAARRIGLSDLDQCTAALDAARRVMKRAVAAAQAHRRISSQQRKSDA